MLTLEQKDTLHNLIHVMKISYSIYKDALFEEGDEYLTFKKNYEKHNQNVIDFMESITEDRKEQNTVKQSNNISENLSLSSCNIV